MLRSNLYLFSLLIVVVGPFVAALGFTDLICETACCRRSAPGLRGADPKKKPGLRACRASKKGGEDDDILQYSIANVVVFQSHSD